MNVLFVFRYYQFNVGGIQTWIYNMVKKLVKENNKVLVLTKTDNPIYNRYQTLFSKQPSTLLDYNGESNWNYGFFERVVYYTFTLEDFAQSCEVKRKNPQSYFDLFYAVPNFKGYDYYYDEPFKGWLKNVINKRLSSIFNKMHVANQIRYFSNSHIDMMINRYHYQVLDRPNYFVPKSIDSLEPFDEKQRREVWKGSEFCIITVSRFDFPHKAYIIGLIDAYEELKKKYPNITLQIVGFGHSQWEIENRIGLLDEDARVGITMIGQTPYEELSDLFKKANLNISVASCCSLGAKNGVLSIPPRHFSYSCEVYGFLPESKNMTASSEPGAPVIPFIEEAINMSEEEYVNKCYAGYCAYKTSNTKASILDANAFDFVLSKKDIRFILFIHFLILHYVPFKHRIWRAFHGEFRSMIKKRIKKDDKCAK